MIFLICISAGLYFLLIASFLYGWFRLEPPQKGTITNLIPVSVIVPVRNESLNLAHIIKSIKQQHYPSHLSEIIIVDDHSTDGSHEIAKELLATSDILICLPGNKTGKKAALWQGISAAKGELLLITDADCIPNNKWIETIVNNYITRDSALILAPVIGNKPQTIFEKWQQLEIFSLLGSTIGSAAIGRPVMCNGANLSFACKYRNEIKPIYTSGIASGDDMFVLEYMKKQYPGKVHFVKSIDATVTTKLTPGFKQFMNQRKRWAAKSRYYTDLDIIVTALVVLLINLTLLVSLVQAIFINNYGWFLLLLGIKTMIDFPLLILVAGFFKERKILYWVPLVQGIYFFYVSFTFLGSFTGNFNWKSRNLKA